MNTPYLFDTSCIDCSNCLGGYKYLDQFCLDQCSRCQAVVQSNPYPYTNQSPYLRWGNNSTPQMSIFYSPRRLSSANYFGSFGFR